MFIVIEGLDGVGKSTITKALAREIDAVMLATPGDKFNSMRSELELIYKDNHQARQLFYMSTVVNISEQVRDLISKGKNVIVDRLLGLIFGALRGVLIIYAGLSSVEK